MTLDVNNKYYSRTPAGQSDYWRKMAAPHYRISKIVECLRDISWGSLKTGGKESLSFPRKRESSENTGSPLKACGDDKLKKKFLEVPSFQDLMDLGCGEGVLLSEIERVFPSVKLFGIDLSKKNIEHAKGTLPRANFIEMDLSATCSFEPMLSEKFDVVTASEIIEHTADPQVFLKNAAGLARKGASLILTTQSGRVFETEKRVGHAKHFSAGRLAELLEMTGWRPMQIYNCGFPFHDLSKWMANISPDISMALFGDRPYSFFQNAVCSFLRVAFKFNSNKKGMQLVAVARKL